MAQPRVGVLNLDFKDVSQMAKDIQANDPLRNAISTVGKVLSDRERDILYRRALAKAQGLEEPDETTIGDLASSAGSKIAEGASWLKDKWDRLDIRSPFEETLTESDKTESPILETPSEKGSREMIGYTPNPSPIVEQDKYRTQLKAPDRRVVEPNDELYFGLDAEGKESPVIPFRIGEEPDTSVNSTQEDKASPIIPFRTGEQVPEQTGTKVDFGTSEPTTKLRSPFAMRTKEEMEAQKPVSPVAGAEVPAEQLKAPGRSDSQMEAWSEMYRLRPERAAFDWDRIAPKGSGASGTVQARLEHDKDINIKIADLTTQLISDMKSNGWTSDSPEYIQRYNDILKLNASKYNPDNKNDVDKFIDRELAGARVDTAKKKQKLDEEKELNDQDKEAITLAYDTSKDTLGKAKDQAVQLGKVYGLLQAGVKGNAPSISAAAKILIQGFDNSAVLGNEIGMLANQSWLGMLNSIYSKGTSGSSYTKSDVKNLWQIADSLANINNSYMDRISSNANAIYESQQGKPSKTIPLLFNGYRVSVPEFPEQDWEKMPEELIDSTGLGKSKGKGNTSLADLVDKASGGAGGGSNGYTSEGDL